MIDLTDRRLVIVHNPHSSRTTQVKTRVFDELDRAGYEYTTLEVQQAPLADNIEWLAPQLKPGDVILSAAGDGSAHAVAHAVMATGLTDIALGFLAYGNFNDLPHAYNKRQALHSPVRLLESAQLKTMTPVAISADGQVIRHALTYATIGWTARAAAEFNDTKVRRQAVKTGKTGLLRSLWRLWRYYLTTRQDSQLASFRLDTSRHQSTSDILIMNGPALARIFKTGINYGYESHFLVRTLSVRRLLPNLTFLIAGLIGQMKGEARQGLNIEFDQPATVPIQCDGEYARLEGVRQLGAKKTNYKLTILTNR